VTRARLVAVTAAMLLLGAVLCWRATVQPLVTDEVEFVQTGPALWRGEGPLACGGPQMELILHHPQAYHLLLGAVAALRGGQLEPLAARVPGILSLLLTLPLALLLVRQLNPDTGRGWAAAALLATSPLAFQGALLVDIDSTILNPALMLFVWLLARRAEAADTTWRGRLLLAVALAGLLWIKLPTPFLAVAAWGLVALFPARRRLLVDGIVITGLGVGLFVVSWGAFCQLQGLDPWAPLAHLVGRGARASLTAAVLVRRSLRLGLWLGPWLPLAALVGVISVWRSGATSGPSRRLVAVVALGLALGYLLVGGESYGFPRYHVPLSPVLAVLAGSGGGLTLRRPAVVWLLGVGSLVYWLTLGDPLLPAYTFSESLAAGDAGAAEATRGVVVTGLLWLLPGLALAAVPALGIGFRAALVTLALASGLATGVHQLRADYSTHYLYGERGTRQAAERLASLAPSARGVLAPKDVAFGSLPCGSYLFSSRTLSRGGLGPLLEEGSLDLIVLRRGHLADATLASTLGDPRVREILATRFRRERIGDFFFYERRGERP
jgi:hypothetical protein